MASFLLGLGIKPSNAVGWMVLLAVRDVVCRGHSHYYLQTVIDPVHVPHNTPLLLGNWNKTDTTRPLQDIRGLSGLFTLQTHLHSSVFCM